MKTFYVQVKIEIEDDADVHEVSGEMEYTFEHPSILDTEIVSVSNKR